MSSSLEAFRKNAAMLIKRAKWTQTETAKRLGWDQGHLSKYLTKVEPGLAKIEEFAALFGVSVQEILSDPTQSQIEPRIIRATPRESLQTLERLVAATERLSPEALDVLAHANDLQVGTIEKLILAMKPAVKPPAKAKA